MGEIEKPLVIKSGIRTDFTVQIPEKLYDTTLKKSYRLEKFLGKGGFARCYEVIEQDKKEIFACKIVNKSLLQKSHQRTKMAQEISIHRDLKQDHIVGFHSFFEDDQFVYIVLELCGKKSLMELQKRRRVITETEARYFLQQLLIGVKYLHDKNIIHRDLKLGNIFINDDMKLKIGDFGLATMIEFDGERKRTVCGTPNYIAPEVLTKKGHSFEVDVWSLGCILYTLLVGRPPFETQNLKETYSKIRRGDYFIPTNRLSVPARLLIQKMLQVDPTARPTVNQIIKSEFMTKFYIPSELPGSCLTMPPCFDARSSYASSDFKTPAPAKRALTEHNPQSPITSGTGSGSAFVASKETIGTEIKNAASGLMKNLRKQIRELLASDPMGKQPLNDDEAEDPNAAPLMWISKWVDYSDKYGFGYQLSDDSIGVSFNDMSHIILLPDGSHTQYIEKNGTEHQYMKNACPQDLQKKIKLLNYFQQYMTENLLKAGGHAMTAETAKATRLPNMWTWFRTSRAVIMVLTNGSLQINNFRDHSKVILCPLMGAITTLDHHKPMRTFKFQAIKQYGCTEELHSKLVYALEKLEVVVGNVNCKKQNSPPK